MIKSMTGFGLGSAKSKEGQINVEIQSLNSRFIDLKFLGYKLSYESEDNFRRVIFDDLKRGSIKVYIEINKIKDDQVITLNQQRFEKTLEILDDIGKKYGIIRKYDSTSSIGDLIYPYNKKNKKEFKIFKYLSFDNFAFIIRKLSLDENSKS